MKRLKCLALRLAALALAASAQAQPVNETLSGTATTFDWTPLYGACLTAGTGSGTIPPCVGMPYYQNQTPPSVLSGGLRGRLGSATDPTVPDPPGRGALRLTNGEIGPSPEPQSGQQRGAVVSNFTFPTRKGLQVLFGTVTYGGNAYGRPSVRMGADGLSFFLADGRYPPSIGAPGGDLGYRCGAGTGYGGVRGGYLGIGVDEYGNFAGQTYGPGRVSVLGAGDINWEALSTGWPQLYPDTLTDGQRQEAVQRTCVDSTDIAYLWDYSNPDQPVKTTRQVPYYYKLISDPAPMPQGVVLANQQNARLPLRSRATALKFKLVISQDGVANLNFRVNGGAPQALLRDVDIRSSNGPVPETLRFGFAGSTGAGTNIHEITCFRAETPRQAAGSGASDTGSTGRVFAGSQIFIGSYDEMNWAGDVRALALNVLSNGYVQPATVATWSGSCTLTGGKCPALGTPSPAVDATPWSSRALLTWSGTAGIPLQWASLPQDMQAALDSPAGTGMSRLAYLSGDRSGELGSGSGGFRIRDSVLGDIIHSSPRWVGPPNAGYPDRFADLLAPGAPAPEQPYSSFRSAYAGRTSVVYIGANDGLVHGFRAGRGSYDTAGNFRLGDAASNDGRELLGFMPRRALMGLKGSTAALDFSSPQYAHNLFVDATPGSGDLFYGGAWHTWLVGGLGFGGNPGGVFNSPAAVGLGALYVLDITDPSAFTSANAATLVVDSLDSSGLACASGPDCAAAFGSQVGTPAITRLHNGRWAVLFGNGLNSSAGTAGLFVGLVDPATGRLQVRFIDTGAGPVVNGTGVVTRNGIAEVAPVDLDGDRITDFVYAGDVLGNVWRFDLSAPDPAQWSAFRLASTGRPITTQVVVDKLQGGVPRVVVAFGTGQAWPQTSTSDVSYASGAQALYGLWDWNFAAWNARVAPGAQVRALASAPGGGTLRSQTLSSNAGSSASFGLDYQTLTRFAVCWWGSNACPAANTDIGWTVPLQGAQLIYSPILYGGLVLLNTTIPPVPDPLSCDFLYPTGYTLAVDMASGGGATTPPFGDRSRTVDGVALNGVGTPLVVSYEARLTLITPDASGAGRSTPLNLGPGNAGGMVGRRLNWLKVR